MTEVRDWSRNRTMWIRVLEQQSGTGVDAWNRRIARQRPRDEAALRRWLRDQGVTGYAQSLLVMERFGYPEFVSATAAQLIDRQFADRPHLRPIYDALIEAASRCGEIAIQARKTFVALVSPRRTFARIRPTTKDRIDLGLRLDGQRPVGRLRPSRMHDTMRVQIELSTRREVDAEVRRWLRSAYDANR